MPGILSVVIRTCPAPVSAHWYSLRIPTTRLPAEVI